MSSSNVREVLYVAIRVLIAYEGTVQKRLASAAINLSTLPTKNDLPKEFEDELRSIIQDLTKEPAVGSEGRIQATTAKMSNQDAKRIAEEIFDLYVRLRGGI